MFKSHLSGFHVLHTKKEENILPRCFPLAAGGWAGLLSPAGAGPIRLRFMVSGICGQDCVGRHPKACPQGRIVPAIWAPGVTLSISAPFFLKNLPLNSSARFAVAQL